MRTIILSIFSILLSCSEAPKDSNKLDTAKSDTISLAESYYSPIFIDTPKMLKAGIHYITISTSPSDKLYFGERFSPYKIEPDDIAEIEQIIDSLIHNQNLKGNFKNKSLADFKYNLFSVKTAKQTLQVRILAILNDKVITNNWNSKQRRIMESESDFSIIYDLTERKVVSFEMHERPKPNPIN